MRQAIVGGRKTRSEIKLGICGEHGGDPKFCRVLSRTGLGLCELFAVPSTDR